MGPPGAIPRPDSFGPRHATRFRPGIERRARANVGILAKKRQKLESLEVVVRGERAAEPPTVWVKLEIVYKLRGQLDEKAVRDAIELSENKYCSVAATLRKTAPIAFHYEINPADGG